jgi:hypothetical protein
MKMPSHVSRILTITETKLRDLLSKNATSNKRSASTTGSSSPRSMGYLVALIFALSILFAAFPSSRAATPTSATIGPAGPMLSWDGTAVGGTSAGEDTCVEGVNCDTYTLNVAAGVWTGKVIAINITWTIPANDYDLYVHFDANNDGVLDSTDPIVASSGDGAPETEEATTIDPSSTGVGRYFVHVVSFSVIPLADQFHGTATVQNKPPSRTATYLKGGITFSPNVTVKAPVAGRDGEPSSRTDKFGNHYVSGIRGVPAGVDLWYFDLRPGSSAYDPLMRHPVYRGQPDSFTMDDATAVGADGGGDVDLAVGMNGADPPTLAFSSLVAANISTGKSPDRGQTFTLNPLGNVTGGAPADDRQWLEFQGNNNVYIFYRTLEPALSMIQRSTDGGLTYGLAQTAGSIGQAGYIDVHQATGTVYISGSTGQVCHSTLILPTGEAALYECHQAAPEPNVANIFFPVKVADDGTLNGTAYVVYSDGHDIYLRHSTDKGVTWSDRVRVSDGAETKTSLLPWIETGPTPGSVGIAWFGTTELTNNDNANWQVFFAQSFNATALSPSFRQVVASDHFIHGSNISTGGTLGSANRNLLDYFQISFDPKGAAVIDYTDDHNDFDGHTFVTRQISGKGINGVTVPAPVAGPGPFSPGLSPPPPQPGPDGEQVTDFAHDVQVGLLGVVPTDDELDILSIKYTCEDTTAGPLLVAAMKVSDLVARPLSNWRMNFTANAPYSTLSPTGEYSFGLSDRGDQFFVRASTDATGAPSYSFGTAVRNSDGSLTYTTQGAADVGTFDTATDTVTVKVLVSKLNPFVTHGPAIGSGSVLVGLRGEAFTSNVNAKVDQTRGGTQFVFGNCSGEQQPPPPPPPPPPGPIVKVTGGGSIFAKVVSFSFNADRTPSGHLNYQDKEQGIHLVSTKILTFVETGPNEVTFSGTGTVGRDPVNFEVTVRDNGEPGKNDFFRIEISGTHMSSRAGNLSQGNIQVHR